ncbi:uncharacterized protein LOC122913718 [Neovison vison]|uniref:uncharacterized protein LOC122913718 n=1 Tax=Neovison vison TaxID=452646 RepID=UPI001CF08176|nr:uncharacterized protein LOC122913718 [Neogale vison]
MRHSAVVSKEQKVCPRTSGDSSSPVYTDSAHGAKTLDLFPSRQCPRGAALRDACHQTVPVSPGTWRVRLVRVTGTQRQGKRRSLAAAGGGTGLQSPRPRRASAGNDGAGIGASRLRLQTRKWCYPAHAWALEPGLLQVLLALTREHAAFWNHFTTRLRNRLRKVKLKEQEQPDSTTVGTSPRRPSPPAWQRHLCGHPAVAGPPPAATPQRPSPSFSSSFPLFSHFFSLLSFVPGTRKAAMTLFPRPFRTQFALSRLHWFGVMEPASSPRASVPTAECAGLCGPPRARHPPAVHLGGLPGCGRVWEAPTPPRLVCKPLARSDLMQLRGRAPRLCPSPPGLHQKPWPHQ